jgi:hypothetical protein
MIEISKAKQVGDYQIELVFNNKIKGVVDLKTPSLLTIATFLKN